MLKRCERLIKSYSAKQYTSIDLKLISEPNNKDWVVGNDRLKVRIECVSGRRVAGQSRLLIMSSLTLFLLFIIEKKISWWILEGLFVQACCDCLHIA